MLRWTQIPFVSFLTYKMKRTNKDALDPQDDNNGQMFLIETFHCKEEELRKLMSISLHITSYL